MLHICALSSATSATTNLAVGSVASTTGLCCIAYQKSSLQRCAICDSFCLPYSTMIGESAQVKQPAEE